MTLSIMTLSITKICHCAECDCADCRDLLIGMLNVIMLSVVRPNVVMLSVVAPSLWLANNNETLYGLYKFRIHVSYIVCDRHPSLISTLEQSPTCTMPR